MKADIVIIGAGISGAVLAERYASVGRKVVVLEKHDHIAGNCYDFIDENGTLVSKYGANLFHTNYEEVWDYVNRFTDWLEWKHKVVARVGDRTVPVSVNITTVNTLLNLNISSEAEMKDWLEKNPLPTLYPSNGEESVLAKVEPILYEDLFRDYTKKQWDKYPAELDASVLDRAPVHTDWNDHYFSDKYQALPVGGYTKLFANILNHPNIDVYTDTDYFDVENELHGFEKLFYTGPIDRFFNFKYSLGQELEYRSINFVTETVNNEFFQENSVVNFPGMEKAFTRIIEYKHFGNQKSDKTTIVKEFATAKGDPYYPVPNEQNRRIYQQNRKEAEKLSDVYFVGRLANYKYFNMDQAFKNALQVFQALEILEEKKVA